MKITKILLLVLLTSIVSFAQGTKSNSEKLGDLFLVLVPTYAYGITYYNDDSVGREQFYKSFGINLIATYGLKYSVSEERPDKSDNQSFPSGHTSVTFQSATFIHKRYGFKEAIPAYLAATYTGWSRVDAKKHYTHDVLAGALLGALSSYYFTTEFSNIMLAPVVMEDQYTLQMKYIW